MAPHPIPLHPTPFLFHLVPSLSTLFTFQQFDSVLWQPTSAYLSNQVELEIYNKSQVYFF